MNKKVLKKSIAIVLTIAMVATMFAFGSTAAEQQKVLQKWDFTGFEDGVYSGEILQVPNSDSSVILGTNNAYWNKFKTWTITDSKVNFTFVKNQGSNVHQFVICFKLNTNLKSGLTYEFASDMLKDTSSYKDLSVFYSPEAEYKAYNYTTPTSADAETIYYQSGEQTVLPASYTFTPSKDLAAGGYIMIRISLNSVNPFNLTFSEFTLSQVIPEYPYMINENDAVYDEWDFSKLEDVSYTYGTAHGPIIGDDDRIVLGASNAQSYWNSFSDLTVENGVITQTFKGSGSKQNEFMLNLKLDTDLVAGKEYTFVSDLDCIRDTVDEGVRNEYLFPGLYYTNDLYYAVDGNDINAMPDDAVEIYQVARSTGGVSSVENFTYTFTPETTLKAGGYLAFRVKTWSRYYTFTISEAKIISEPTNVLKSYDLTTEQDRALLLSSRETTLVEHDFGDDTVLKWDQGGIGFSDFDFEAGKTYRITLNYSSGASRRIDLWQAPKDSFVDADRKWIKTDLTTVPVTGGIGVNNLGSYTFDITVPTLMEGYTLYFYNSYSGGTFPIKGITISEYKKAIPMAAAKPAAPSDEERGFTKIVLPQIDTDIMQYSILGADGKYVALDGNVAEGLKYDTEYNFVVKYLDSYRYYEGENSEALTVKTRKQGDVTGDEIVNIVDLVRLKKGIVAMNDSPIYDVDPSGDAASLILVRRMILGLIK